MDYNKTPLRVTRHQVNKGIKLNRERDDTDRAKLNGRM
jgi:hypothetical protein